MKIEHYKFPKSLLLILVVAAGLRLLGAWHRNLVYDESAHLACAETIDFRPAHFNLVFRSVDHPLLSVYIIRISSYLFGNSNFSLRILHVLFGTLTIIPIYLLGKKAFSENVGLCAAALLAVDQFHLTWSYFIVPEVLLFFFVSLTLYQFLRSTESRSRGDLFLFGLLLGFCYLAKETSILLLPIFWFCLLTNKKKRCILWSPNWYFAHILALIVVCPDIIWNITHFYEGYFYRDMTLLSKRIVLSSRSIILYIGEITQLITGPLGGFSMTDSMQNPTICHWPVGILYLFGTILAFRFWRCWPVYVLMMTFSTYFLFFADEHLKYTYWWASISLIPSIIFGGWILLQLASYASNRIPKVLAVMLLVYLCFHAVLMALRPGLGVQHLSAGQLVESIIKEVSSLPTNSKIAKYEWGLLRTLHIAGSDTNVYAYLARVAYVRKQWNRAEYFVRRSLELDEKNEIALKVNELLEKYSQ
jgi:4-amino-4-deoxy-L-arabinose transferase-like glycosyltransferase